MKKYTMPAANARPDIFGSFQYTRSMAALFQREIEAVKAEKESLRMWCEQLIIGMRLACSGSRSARRESRNGEVGAADTC